MKRAIFGALLAIGTAVAVVPVAQAQPWQIQSWQGQSYGYAQPYDRPGWGQDDWRERMERREMRREFWRQQRELSEQRAYEAGKRDAWQQQRQPWGYR